MYVQCERCKTEYDFDDALVSERGTTVKCTSCGHQFKVRRSSEGALDKWTVTTKNGTKQVYTTLRELQKAILAKQIARQDLLARGDGPPRPLGTIAELEPFFDETQTLRAGEDRVQMPLIMERRGGRSACIEITAARYMTACLNWMGPDSIF